MAAIVPLLQGNSQQAIRNAVVGCIAGGVIGLAYGSYVDARAQSFTNDQERVARLTAAAQDDVVRYARVNASTHKLIGEERRRLAQVNAKQQKVKQAVAVGETDMAARAETIRLLEKQLAEIDGNIKTIEADQRDLSGRGVDTAPLTVQRQALATQQTELAKKIAQLKSLSNQPA